MAMYKDTDITAPMIQEKFPAIAAEIVAGANTNSGIAITAESIRETHPDIVTTLQNEGRASAGLEVASAMASERERIITIQALAQPGYESIISTAVADSTVSPDSVKIKMFDAMNANRSTMFDNHKADGQALGVSLSELGGGSADGSDTNVSDDQKAASAMAEAGKKARGEM